MSISLTHAFVSAQPQSSNSALVSKNEWNAEHRLTMTGPAILGRLTTDNGAVNEVSLSSLLSFIGLPTSHSQGDILYSTGSAWVALAKSATATRYLSNTGASNNPAWAQVDLSNGVIGDLPFANLAQIAGLSVLGVAGNVTADVAAITAGTDHQVLRRSGTALTFGAVNLAQSAAVTGVLAVGNGGTGTATQFTAGSVVFAGAGGVYSQDNANLFWDDTNNRLGVGTAVPQARIHAGPGADVPVIGHTIYATENGTVSIGARDSTNDAEIYMLASAAGAQISATGPNNVIDIQPLPADGVSSAQVRLFRATNTSGTRSFDIHRGDNTTTVDHRLVAGASATSYIGGNGGNLIVGHSAAIAAKVGGVGFTPGLQRHATSVSGSIMSAQWTVDNSAGYMVLAKSRGASMGDFTVVQSGDSLGHIIANGADGTDFAEAAKITFQVDGTPGSNDMPGRILFLTTPDGSETAVERMRIDSSGNVGIGGTASNGQRLYITHSDNLWASNVAGVVTRNTNTGSSAGSTFAAQHPSNVGKLAFMSIMSGTFGVTAWPDAAVFGSIGTTPIIIAQDTNTRVYIDTAGKVGIGTTSPQGMIHTQSNSLKAILDGGGNTAASFSGLWLIASATTPDTSNYALLSDGSNLLVNRPSGSSIFFRENNATQMTLLSGGNLGIGVSPNYKLDVSSTASLISNFTSSQSVAYIQVTGSGGNFLFGVSGALGLIQGAANFVLELQSSGGLVTTSLMKAGGVFAMGDVGGLASSNSLTNVSNLTANSTGVGTIKFKGATSRDSSGFIKFYIGTTAYYVPVFSAITG